MDACCHYPLCGKKTKKDYCAEHEPIDIDAWARRLGAAALKDQFGTGPEYRLQTKVGTLHIGPRHSYIWCRFDDVEAARKHFGVTRIGVDRLNPYSGKWNWHFNGRCDAEVESFKRAVEALVR